MKSIYRIFVLFGALCVLLPSVFASEMMVGDASAGKVIFDNSCRYCHTNNENSKFGPSLMGIAERRNVVWLHEWLKNPREMIKKDVAAKVVRGKNKYNMTMPALPDMQDDAKRADVIAYLLSEF